MVCTLTYGWEVDHSTQFYGRNRQCGHPVGAQCSMGLGRNPLINGLIQHTFKINFLLVAKIPSNTFQLDKTFPCWSQVTMLFKNFLFFLTKKNEPDFQLGTPPPSPQSSWKFIEVTHSQRSGRGRESGVIIILLKPFFFKIPDLVHRRTLAQVIAGNRR